MEVIWQASDSSLTKELHGSMTQTAELPQRKEVFYFFPLHPFAAPAHVKRMLCEWALRLRATDVLDRDCFFWPAQQKYRIKNTRNLVT